MFIKDLKKKISNLCKPSHLKKPRLKKDPRRVKKNKTFSKIRH